ncbi:MAG: redox-sensing transcriptional repressor Rex [Clostridiaceae bacterium]|nr:redox-sensing transcriptional repressor Rex [Clostridiaceae bacterium]
MRANAVVIKRLSVYLQFLRQLPPETTAISATTIAKNIGYGDVQVRKDLASVSGEGKPRTGYEVAGLKTALENYLGFNSPKKAVIVGAGKLGTALLEYEEFAHWGLEIAAAFDIDESKCTGSKPVYNISRFKEFCEKEDIKIGIITVPASAAQQVCDLICETPIKAVWSFAPTHLNVPEGVTVQYENMAASLANISCRID